MTKKAIAEETLVKLIAFVFVLGIAIIIFLNINTLLQGETNKETIHNWVIARGALKGAITPTPPVSDLQEPLEIDDIDDLVSVSGKPPKVVKEIADSMADCWTAFDKGQTDFLNNIQKEVFCFPCRAIVFSDDVKRENPKIIGLNNYLNDTHIRGEDSPTYLQFLSNDNLLSLEQEDLGEDTIIADKNLHIYFFAASGRGLTNIVANVLGFGDVVPEDSQDSRAYNPNDVTQPESEYEGLSGSEKAELSGLGLLALPAGRYALIPSLTEGAAITAATATTTTSTTVAEDILVRKATLQVSERGAQTLTMEIATGTRTTTTATTAVAEEIAKKAVKRGIVKRLAAGGVKFVASKAFLPVTIALGAYGAYQVVFGEKPFVADVMIVEPEKVHALCNE